MTESSGVKFTYRTGSADGKYTLLETLGGGAALFDFDRDGDLDLFLTGGGKLATDATAPKPLVKVTGVRSALYRNDGPWKFTDVTEIMGLGSNDFYAQGMAVGDYNRDGFPDLFVTGFGRTRLYRNEAGEKFIETPIQPVASGPRWFTSATWGDFDRDGWIDLFACCYADWQRTDDVCLRKHLDGSRVDTCAPSQYPGQQSVLWRNLGDGTFADVSQEAGIVPGMRSLGTVTADLDQDGWLDLFVANDVHENQLYFGTPQFPLLEQAVLVGVAFSETGARDGSMGTDIADYDGDGLLDLFIANFAGQDNMLMKGVGNRAFENQTRATGLAAPSRRWVKFASLFADFDVDGWLDLFVANGHVNYEEPELPFLQPAQLFQNQQGQRYHEAGEVAGPYFSVPHAGRGAAVGDIDNDGAPDLVVVHQDSPVTILRNRHQPEHWVTLSLRGRESGSDAIGAQVSYTRGNQTQTRVVCGGGSYLSHSDRRVLLVTDAGPVQVKVVWPGGYQEVFARLTTRTTHELVEGTGQRP